MLPGELMAKYGRSGGYGNFLDWVGKGAKHPTWSAEAEAAAAAAGVARNVDTTGWTQRLTDWGETQDLDPQGNVRSTYNPDFIPWLQAWDAAHPGMAQGSTAPNVGDQAWIDANNAPSPWATDDTPGPGPGEEALPDVYGQGYGSVNPGGQSDPMTVSRQAQTAQTNQQQLAKLLSAALGKKVAGMAAVRNPFALSRAFGGGAMANPFRR